MSPDAWVARLVSIVGPVSSIRPLAGEVSLVQASGRMLVVKVRRGVLDEADGLERIRKVNGAPPVPEIVFAEAGLLVTGLVDQISRTAGHEEALGRALAALHSAPFPQWGGGSSWIGACPVDPALQPDGAAFYAARLCQLAKRCELE
jgi:hypothetical protein